MTDRSQHGIEARHKYLETRKIYRNKNHKATKLGHDTTIHVMTKIPEEEGTLGKTYVTTENLVAIRIKGIGNNLSCDKETG